MQALYWRVRIFCEAAFNFLDKLVEWGKMYFLLTKHGVRRFNMTVSRIINMMAGMMVMISILLAHMAGTVDITEPNWLWLGLFVGFNLFQFSFTGFCPMDIVLRKMGVKTEAEAAGGCGSGGCGSSN